MKSALLILFACFLFSAPLFSQEQIKLRKKDRKKDIEMVTTDGTIILRLSDSTPLHRDNFLRLVKSHFYDSVLFHRVIQYFMIQAGDPASRNAIPGQALGDSSPPYTIPAEFRVTLFHKRGVLAAARESDDVNPLKVSSSSQFYIVQGKKFTDAGLDSVETRRLKRKIPEYQREVYKTLGGTPHLDLNYTIFGEVVSGMTTVDLIASEPRSIGDDKDRPLKNVRILSARLIKRKKY
ncbi:MAG TPA: peptidylprolyl isomerase [Puia sp.]|jgi:cyclophilin family peptidyl-prolyl cis-trans isomerase|nr:peptidylprolyl isomerase [Puia sp.]